MPVIIHKDAVPSGLHPRRELSSPRIKEEYHRHKSLVCCVGGSFLRIQNFESEQDNGHDPCVHHLLGDLNEATAVEFLPKQSRDPWDRPPWSCERRRAQENGSVGGTCDSFGGFWDFLVEAGTLIALSPSCRLDMTTTSCRINKEKESIHKSNPCTLYYKQ